MAASCVRSLVPRAIKRERAHGRAVEQFLVQNLHTTGTTLNSSNSISLRINQNLTPNLPEPGRGGAGAVGDQ